MEKNKRKPEAFYFLSPLSRIQCGPAGLNTGLLKYVLRNSENFNENEFGGTKFDGSANRLKY